MSEKNKAEKHEQERKMVLKRLDRVEHRLTRLETEYRLLTRDK